MVWTRRVLITLWALLLIVAVAPLVERGQWIHDNTEPGPQRTAAIRGLLVEAMGVLVVGPLFVFMMLSYGIGVRPALDVWSTGGPWFVALWRRRSERAQSIRTRFPRR